MIQNTIQKVEYTLQEKIKLYENENKLLRKQLNENSKMAESEIQALKEKLMLEINEVNEKQLEFKIQKQNLEDNYAKICKTKGQLEKKNIDYEEENNKIKTENQGLHNKIKEIIQENVSLRKQISSLERNKNEKNEKDKESQLSKAEIDQLRDKNKELENKIIEISANKKVGESSIQKILEEYNKILENYSILTNKLEEKEQAIHKQNEDFTENKAKLAQENQDLKKELKISQKNVKIFQLEKRKFMDEIQKVKNDLKVYENSAKNLKICQLRLDSSIKFQQDILKVLKKDASKTLYNCIYQMVQKFNSSLLPGNSKKPLNIEDLNNSRISIFSEKNSKQIKTKRSLSLSNKSQKSSKVEKSHKVNTSMFCSKKTTNSPLIKSQKNLFKTENSSHKKKITVAQNSRQQSPSKFSSRLSEKNTQCFQPSWGNEKLSDIQNILKTATNEESERNTQTNLKENSNKLSHKQQKNSFEKKRIEKLDYQEASDEVYILEKNLTQVKKDYKNLMSRSKSEQGEAIRNELNEMAKDLEQKTEFLIWAKKELKKKL